MDIHFKLGRGYHLSSLFEMALKEYKIHLTKLTGKDVEADKKITNRLIAECNNAIEMVKNPIRVWVDNLGKNINSPYPDYAAQISADESVIIYTSRRPSEYSDELYDKIDNHIDNILKDPKTYNLYGGEPMESFGWSVLGQDRDQITNRKEGRKKADEMGGITGERKNSFLKKHSKKPDFLPQLNMVKNNSFKTPISSLGLFEQIERIKNLM